MWIPGLRQIRLLTERTRTSPEAVLLCSQSRLFDTPKMLWTHWSCAHCFLSSPVTFTITSVLSLEVLHLLLSEHELPLLHGATPTHDVKPRRWDLVQAASDVLHGHGGKVLVVRVVRTTHDVCTDAHLELGLVLVLYMFRPVPAVGNALVFSFARVRSPLWVRSFLSDLLTPRRYWLVLLWTPRLTCLSGPVSGPQSRRRRSRAPNSHYLCNVRPWLRQGLDLFTC